MEVVIGRWTLDYADAWKSVDDRFKLQQNTSGQWLVSGIDRDDSLALVESGMPQMTSPDLSRRQLVKLTAEVLDCRPQLVREHLYYLTYDSEYIGLYVVREGRRWYLADDYQCNPYKNQRYITTDLWAKMTVSGMTTRQAILDAVEPELSRITKP